MTCARRSKKFRFLETQNRDNGSCENAFSTCCHRQAVILLIRCDRKPKKDLRLVLAPLFRQLANIVSGPCGLTGCLCTQWMEEALECKSFTTFLQQCEIPPSAARRLQSQRCFLVSARYTHAGQSSPTAWVQRRGKEKPNKEDEGALSWQSVIQRPA